MSLRQTWPLIVLAVAVCLWLTNRHSPVASPDTMEYLGQSIKLSRAYATYEAYKEDPDNIDPSENVRLERLMTAAPVPRAFASRQEMIFKIMGFRFPGYGLTCFGEKTSPDGSVLAGYALEIPRADKNRYLIYCGRNGRFALIDDFVAAGDLGIMGVRQEHNSLVYQTMQGTTVLTRPLTVK
jgi:hypothetical protein